MIKNPSFNLFKENPVSDVVKAVLAGDLAAIWRKRRNPRSGWTSLHLKRFPTSASEASYPQRVKKNGS